MKERRFRFCFEPYQIVLGLPLGITPFTCWVTVTSDELMIRYGLWSVRTLRANVKDAAVTGPYGVLKTAGPPHLSFVDQGISFVTRRSEGVCVRFHEPVPGIMPFGLDRLVHPGATVTVEDPDELIELLTAS